MAGLFEKETLSLNEKILKVRKAAEHLSYLGKLENNLDLLEKMSTRNVMFKTSAHEYSLSYSQYEIDAEIVDMFLDSARDNLRKKIEKIKLKINEEL